MSAQYVVLSAILMCCYSLHTEEGEAQPVVLVTGGAGYIGSQVALECAQHGNDVIVIDSKIKKRFPWARYIEADFADGDVLADIFTNNKVDAVIHCAARAVVCESFKDPLAFYETNVSKTLVLLRVMRAYNVDKIIFASSRSIYGNAQFLPVTEEHPRNPLSPYARSKVMVEDILEDAHKAYGLKYVSLRFINTVGANPEFGIGEEHNPENHIVPILFHAAKNNLPFTIFGDKHPTTDGTCVRSWIHVKDVAGANRMALEYLRNGGPSDVFQLGTNLTLSIKELVKAAEDFYHTKVNVIVAPNRPADSPELVSDFSKAKKILGWEPQYSTLNYIMETTDQFGFDENAAYAAW